MEIMEDGNLMDRVQILIQRDLEYYKLDRFDALQLLSEVLLSKIIWEAMLIFFQTKQVAMKNQKVLQESLCANVVGGRLDFPRHASFAAVKLVLWWEEEYVAAYRRGSGLMQNSSNADCDDEDDMSRGCGGIIKSSDPSKFMALVTKSAEDLLSHLHILTQEALDHADLTVLTGTIGAAALLRNCLWCYIQNSPATTPAQKSNTQQLQKSYKQYQEMAEALAERLLDLHCRLLSLYILQDAESLDWESTKPFFESERGSYIVQMWWLYMEGTRENLWNTVPPKMAQRVFSGMLNESLTILCTRYSQALPSMCRSSLFAVDISNILLCVSELLPAICDNAEELIGLALNIQNKIIRDVHAKCQELFCCLLLRGAPLNILHKLFRRGINSIEFCRIRNAGPSPWFVFTCPHLFSEYPHHIIQLQDFKPETAVALELSVLLIQPQPNWALLLKVLLLSNCKILVFILQEILRKFRSPPCERRKLTISKCENFLCTSEGLCNDAEFEKVKVTRTHGNSIIMAATYIILTVGNSQDIVQILLPAIESSDKNWAVCFDRRQVWNQKRPAWFDAILSLLKPLLPPIITIVIGAVKTGASMYQAMSIILACFSQLWDCVPVYVPKAAAHISDILPSDIHPLGNSVLLQILISGLYSALLDKSEKTVQKESTSDENKEENKNKPSTSQSAPSTSKTTITTDIKNSTTSFDGTVSSIDAIALALAESLCSIDEDNKHTEQIEEFLDTVDKSLMDNDIPHEGCKRVECSQQIVEILVSDLLMTPEGKKGLKILQQFICSNKEWLYKKLNIASNDIDDPNRMIPEKQTLLYTMFHIKDRPFDQLLTGEWTPDWYHFLQIPTGLSVERIWSHLSMRWEFSEDENSSLTAHDSQIVGKLTDLLKLS